MFICTGCQKEYENQTKFCSECGGKVEEKIETAPPVYACSQCGKEYDETIKFCSECGGKVTEKITVPPVYTCCQCQKEYDENTKFCSACGGKVAVQQAVVQPVTPAQPAAQPVAAVLPEPVQQVPVQQTEKQSSSIDNCMSIERAKEIFRYSVTPILGQGCVIKILNEYPNGFDVYIGNSGVLFKTRYNFFEQNGKITFNRNNISLTLKPALIIFLVLLAWTIFVPLGIISNIFAGKKDAETKYALFDMLLNSMLEAPDTFFCTKTDINASGKKSQELLNTFFCETVAYGQNFPWLEYPGKFNITPKFINENFLGQISPEDVILSWNAGLTGSGRSLFTTKGIYHSHGLVAKTTEFIPYSSIKGVGLSLFLCPGYNITVPVIVNDKNQAIFYIPSQDFDINTRIANHKKCIKEMSCFIEAMKRIG